MSGLNWEDALMTILWFQLVSMEAGGGGRDTNVSKT